jgi:hypothetical protein
MSNVTKTLSKQIQEMERSWTTRELPSLFKKTNSFQNPFDSTENMILNASTENIMTSPAEPSSGAKALFKLSSAEKARIWLKRKLMADYLYHLNVKPAMVTNLYRQRLCHPRRGYEAVGDGEGPNGSITLFQSKGFKRLLVRLLRGFSLFVAPRELIRASKSSEA